MEEGGVNAELGGDEELFGGQAGLGEERAGLAVAGDDEVGTAGGEGIDEGGEAAFPARADDILPGKFAEEGAGLAGSGEEPALPADPGPGLRFNEDQIPGGAGEEAGESGEEVTGGGGGAAPGVEAVELVACLGMGAGGEPVGADRGVHVAAGDAGKIKVGGEGSEFFARLLGDVAGTDEEEAGAGHGGRWLRVDGCEWVVAGCELGVFFSA
jgi:hypothetical protein